MKIVKLICPSCGAQLDVDLEGNVGKCQYCGSALFVDNVDERREYVYRKIDEAKIKKAEYQAEIRKTELKQASLKEKIMFAFLGVYALAILAVIIVAIIKSVNGSDDGKLLWFVVGLMISLPLMIYLTVLLSKSDALKNSKNPIKIIVSLWIFYFIIAFVVYLLASGQQETLFVILMFGVIALIYMPFLLMR